MPQRPATSKPFAVSTFVILTLTVVALYFARDVVIPTVLAVLLAFLLGRPVAWLERRKVGRVSSVLLVVTVAFLVIGVLGYVVGNQVVGLANNLGNYQDEIKKKVISLRGTGSDVGRTFEKLSHDLRNASWVPRVGGTPQSCTIAAFRGLGVPRPAALSRFHADPLT